MTRGEEFLWGARFWKKKEWEKRRKKTQGNCNLPSEGSKRNPTGRRFFESGEKSGGGPLANKKEWGNQMAFLQKKKGGGGGGKKKTSTESLFATKSNGQVREELRFVREGEGDVSGKKKEK